MNSTNRWRYKVIEVKPRFLGATDTTRVQGHLDSLGNQGWELVGVAQANRYVSTYLYLKKPA